MVSAVQDEHRGFGFPMKPAELGMKKKSRTGLGDSSAMTTGCVEFPDEEILVISTQLLHSSQKHALIKRCVKNQPSV